MFYDVQDVLDGRKKAMRPKIVVDDNLPLRGFLITKQKKWDKSIFFFDLSHQVSRLVQDPNHLVEDLIL